MNRRVIEWRRVMLDGEETARVTCPDCKQEYLLDHDVDREGNVTPSLDCPTDGCGFHEFVQLAGWSRREIKPVSSRGSGDT